MKEIMLFNYFITRKYIKLIKNDSIDFMMLFQRIKNIYICIKES